MTDPLVDRFDRYFRHPDFGHDVLRRGDRCIACANVRRAIHNLLDRSSGEAQDQELFDATLEEHVKTLQEHFRHRVRDGEVGPGTRRLIVSNLLDRFDASIFKRYARPEAERRGSVFMSYAREDSDRVVKLVQWLRDRNVSVVMDTDSFTPGETIQDEIRRAVAAADKVIAVLSAHSVHRDWPRVETAVAEQLERFLKERVLIYVRLDETPLPTHDAARIAIDGHRRPLSETGNQILGALGGGPRPLARHEYDEDKPL